jgi:hypothetical protein
VTISLFETIKTTSQTLIKNLTKLLDKYGRTKKIIVYVKDERSNLNVMTTIMNANAMGFIHFNVHS